MISLLVTLLLAAIVVYALTVIVNMIPLPDSVKTLVYLIIGVFFLVWIFNSIGVAFPVR